MGVPRPVPSSLASEPSASSECVTTPVMQTAEFCEQVSAAEANGSNRISSGCALLLNAISVSLSKSKRDLVVVVAVVATSIGSLHPPPNATGCTYPLKDSSVPGKPLAPRRDARVPAVSCPASRRGAESPRTPWGSRRIGCLRVQSPKSARAKTRRRRCATPNHCASRVDHSTIASAPTAQPSVPQPLGGTLVPARPASASTTAAKSRPELELKAPGTFSQRANRVPHQMRHQEMMSMAGKNRPERSPERPFCLPATDRSWQGDPNTTRSM